MPAARGPRLASEANRQEHEGVRRSAGGRTRGENEGQHEEERGEGHEEKLLGAGEREGLRGGDEVAALGGGFLELGAEQGGVDAEGLGGVGGELVAGDAVGDAADVGQKVVEGFDLGFG